jgi:sortase A
VTEPAPDSELAKSAPDLVVNLDSAGAETIASSPESGSAVPTQRGNRVTKVLVRARTSRPGRAPRRQLSPVAAIYGAAFSIAAALFLGFAADVTFIGALHHNRDQHIGYSQLRLELAKGTAPVGPLDFRGIPLPLGAPIALLDIPEIGLHEVVFEGTTAHVLEMGAGHARSTLLPGQAGTSVVMGRRAAYGGAFRDIGTLKAGQQFTTTTGQGTSTYKVIDVRRAGDPIPTAPPVGSGRLQLLTATGPAYQPSGLLRVDADLVTPAQLAPSVSFNIAPLTKAELPLQGDSSVLIVLVLWAQGLLVAAGLVAWARVRWGIWQTWIVGLPLLTTLGLAVADRVAQLLPNLM